MKIFEIHVKPKGKTLEDRLEDEYIVLKNATQTPIRIAGWVLGEGSYKKDGSVSMTLKNRFVFPTQLTNGLYWEVQPKQFVFLITGDGINYITGGKKQLHFHWSMDSEMWNLSGKCIVLARPKPDGTLFLVDHKPLS